MELDSDYWTSRYLKEETGWDIGYPSTPLKTYFDQVQNKAIRILIPGAGNAYEAEYLHNCGFTEVHVIDLSDKPFERLKISCPDFPESHLHIGDFFEHSAHYDLMVEQTFFCALDPRLRKSYVAHAAELLKPEGKLVGLLFNDPLFADHPPFGGTKKEYLQLFSDTFYIDIMETAHNSIPPRSGRELFIKLRVK